MSDHVLDWLGAYHDGELHGDRREQVEAHLETCAACQAELTALRTLSTRLQETTPMPTRTPPEKFVAQVRLRLPQRTAPATSRQRVRQAAGLWLPLTALGLWAFGQAVLLVAGAALSLTETPLALTVLGYTVPILSALGAPPAAGSWLAVLVLDLGLTAVAAMLGAGSLAAWWTARETEPNLPAGAGSEAG